MALLDPDARRVPVDHHLVAGIPTPNGPTHLGHLGGPFLRMDVLARFRRLCGDRAYLVSGTDAFESHVRLASVRSALPPAEIARRYHAEIEHDLVSLDVVHDAFIDPLDARWASRYGRWHTDLLDRLRRLGHVERRHERVPVSRGRHLWGGFLAGHCPGCGRPVVGGSCEECGMWFSPGAVVQPRSGLDDADVEWRDATNLVLRLDDAAVRRVLTASDLGPEHRAILAQYLDREGPIWPITQQGDWGVPAPPEVSAPGVFATYGLGILAYAALCGEEYGLLSGTGVNALAADSGVVTVSAQGFDSIVPDAFAIAVLDLLGPGLGSYDHLTLNRFLLLEGSKFSTSRRHVIGTREVTRIVDSDVVRHYLARISPDNEPTDFRIEEFAALAEEHLVNGLERRAAAAWNLLGSASGGSHAGSRRPPAAWTDQLEDLLGRQAAALDPRRLRLAAVVDALDAWPGVDDENSTLTVGDTEDVDRAYWWLKGAAVLAWSLTPRWGRATWQALGHAGDPSLAKFWDVPAITGTQLRRRFKPVDAAAVRGLAGAGAVRG